MRRLRQILTLLFLCEMIYAQITNCDNTDSLRKTLTKDLLKGIEPALTCDTLKILKSIYSATYPLDWNKYSKYPRIFLENYNPSFDEAMTTTGGLLPEKISTRTLRFVLLFYGYKLIFKNELTDSLPSLYITYTKKQKQKYITDDLFHKKNEDFLNDYILDEEKLKYHFKKMFSLYRKWLIIIIEKGLYYVKCNKIGPFDNSEYSWGFKNIPSK